MGFSPIGLICFPLKHLCNGFGESNMYSTETDIESERKRKPERETRATEEGMRVQRSMLSDGDIIESTDYTAVNNKQRSHPD